MEIQKIKYAFQVFVVCALLIMFVGSSFILIHSSVVSSVVIQRAGVALHRPLRRQLTLTIKPGSPLAEFGITRRQMEEFRDAFNVIDKDGDGSITTVELHQVMRSLEQFARTEELVEMIKEVDADGDGNVSFEEFVMIMCNMGVSQAEEDEKELRDAFRVFDKQNRGYICASDLRAVLECLGEDLDEEDIEDMIREVDIDDDGRIDFNEFVQALGKPDNDDEDEDYLENEVWEKKSESETPEELITCPFKV